MDAIHIQILRLKIHEAINLHFLFLFAFTTVSFSQKYDKGYKQTIIFKTGKRKGKALNLENVYPTPAGDWPKQEEMGIVAGRNCYE